VGADGVDITVCLAPERICLTDDGVEPTVAGRVCMLHELSHAWIAEHVTDAQVARVLALTDLESWYSRDVPWAERGVEFAAETMAWGLMDTTFAVRLDDPPCALLHDVFVALTGAEPLVDCDPPR